MANSPNHDVSFENALRAFLRKERRPSDGCPDSSLLSAYYERTLGEDEVGAIEGHVATCADCQAELALLARLDLDTSPAAEPAGAASAVELTAAQLADAVSDGDAAPAEEIEEDIEEQSVEAEVEEEIEQEPEAEREPASEDERPFAAAPGEFIPAPRRSSWRWVAPTALAASAVIAVLVTYRFAVDDASRQALMLQRPSPAREAPAQLPVEEPQAKAQRTENEQEARQDAFVAGGKAGGLLEQETAVPPIPPAPAAAPGGTSAPPAAKPAAPRPEAAPPASFADKLAPAKKDEPAHNERAREKQLRDEGAALGATASAPLSADSSLTAAPRAAAPENVIVSSRASGPVRWRFKGSKIERSDDAGRSWQAASTSLPSLPIAASSPTSDACWVVGKDGMIMRTSDGQNWQAVKSPTTADVVHVSAWSETSATIKAADGSRFSTNDGGVTWSKL